MTQSFMGDKQCWMEHMALNSTDGLDPEGIRLRASEGLLGVDYFFPGYAVWAGLIEAAADLGYDTNNLVSSNVQRMSNPQPEQEWACNTPSLSKGGPKFMSRQLRPNLAAAPISELAISSACHTQTAWSRRLPSRS